MEKFRAEGYTKYAAIRLSPYSTPISPLFHVRRSIGVSNFEIEDLQKVLKIAKVKPSVNQVRASIFLPFKLANLLIALSTDSTPSVQLRSEG